MKKEEDTRKLISYDYAPQVLVPYPGIGKENEQDIFLFLRPETNNYKVESLILSVFRKSSEYKKAISVQYLANLSGKFIENTNLFRKHYAMRLFFAQRDKYALSSHMKERFEYFFSVKFETSEIIGGFEALNRLEINFEDLLRIHISEENTLHISGQTIKKIFDKNGIPVFVINKDLPAIFMRTYTHENCAVIMFRTTLPYEMLNEYIRKIYKVLIENNVIPFVQGGDTCKKIKTVFRYSEGPFEQLRDSIEFLYHSDGTNIELSDTRFAQYLYNKDISYDMMKKLITFPLLCYQDNFTYECNESTLFEQTKYTTYEQAYRFLGKIQRQRIIYN